MREAADISRDRLRLEGLAGRVTAGGVVVGLLGLAAAAFLAATTEHGWERFLGSYLVSYAFWLSLCLGGLFFVILQHLTRAGWGVVVRRLAEAVAANAWLMALLLVPILLGMHEIYHWTHEDAVAHDALLQHKEPYLNVPFFLVRCAVYFAVWTFLSLWYFRRSVAQDEWGDEATTLGLERLSAPAMIAFALTLTFASIDLLMSVDPHWFSTIYGVYYFAGATVGFLALLIVCVVLLQRSGRLRHTVGLEHFHDMGKLLFAFVVFWAYIAFSQYMLLWYANIPEETGWLILRQDPPWTSVSLLLLFGHFLAPFLLLISRRPKRRPALLAVMALWLLVMHWVDLYWLVMPTLSPEEVPFGLMDVALAVGLGGLFLAAAAFRLRGHSLVPLRDPRLSESLALENV